MLSTRVFGEELKRKGYDFYSGVPCSFLKDLINYAINECDYVMATNEGDAVAACAGAYLGGRKSVFLCQNSGLTNATSPLTSLTWTFQLPVLGIVSLRGEPGLSDEPQHELMGPITTKMLDLMEIPWEYLASDNNEAVKQIERADNIIKQNKTFFFVVKKGTFEKEELKPQTLKSPANVRRIVKTTDEQKPKRTEALARINAVKDQHTVHLATTGKTGRELYEVEDASNNLYMVGSMGCISNLGLGLALAKPQKKIIAIDGDGAFLMRMGSIATNAYYSPSNLCHILLDNNVHDSTGGQATVSHMIHFVDLAASVGYTHAIHVHSLDELEQRIKEWKTNGGLTFLYMRISKGSPPELGRPKVKPYQVKERLMAFLRS
ncbi:phosphonopyruvate decarboxylase [bacterium]|nr:phosphonopyruvate decarboxylase [bacterium]